ncbi:MAG: 2-amino-4-hydroxy-6-hydroxymethyldihydropteridine diphosphokinase [Methylococcus sp.]|nr:MAG: 2-amino-4-hydroxy-6-hydroxymethyldihydropteridine diphosphokinase [Methylococcus sp.]
MPRLPDARSVRAYIGLGGNLDQPAARIRRARVALSVLPNTREAAFSSLYRSAPMGPSDQPDYVNAVMALDTGLEPLALLDHLQAIENAEGRVRMGERWGPRTLDLDLLLYGEDVIQHERLTVPHPGLHQREFVLYPLFEIAPDLKIPGWGALRDWVAACPRRGLEAMGDE